MQCIVSKNIHLINKSPCCFLQPKLKLFTFPVSFVWNDCKRLVSGIHRLKQSLPKRSSGELTMYDPIFPVAMEIGAETCLLCLDEFQVRRVAGCGVAEGVQGCAWVEAINRCL